jgi:hypothetical protein
MRAEQSEDSGSRGSEAARIPAGKMALSVEAEASSAVTRVGQQAGEMARLAEHMDGFALKW